MQTEEEFWRHTEPQPNGCLYYIGPGSRGRYGHVRITYQGRRDYAHRVAYRLYHGEIPTGLVVGHLDDTPWCVARDCIEAISPQENVRQRDERNRRTPFLPRGTMNWSSKLSAQEVIAIRRARDTRAVSASALSVIFQVSRSTIYEAWGNRTTYQDVAA